MASFQFRVVREEFRTGFVTQKGSDELVPAVRPHLTFHLSEDGGQTWVPSMKWYPECNKEGLPKDYYVQRCIGRLMAGNSTEAFGGPKLLLNGPGGQKVVGQVNSGRPARAEVRLVEQDGKPDLVDTGKGLKPRAAGHKFECVLDGQMIGTAETEKMARGFLAVRAFFSRNKLGRLGHALEKLQECFPGRECRVFACPDRDAIRATVDGEDYSIGWVPPERSDSGQWEVEVAVEGSDIPYRFKKRVQENTDGS